MAVPTKGQIGKWRERWKKYPTLADEIVSILMEDDRPPENAKEATDRLRRVNDILPEEYFDVYEGEGGYLGWYKKREYVFGPVVDLRGINLSEKDLKYIFLGSAHLEGAYLWNAHLEGAYLRLAHLEGAYLRLAHLEGTNLIDAHLERADLGEAHLEGTNLLRANLEGAFLWGAHLERADLMSAHLEGADLMGVNLEGADLFSAHLEGARLSYAKVGKLENFDKDCNLDDEEKEKLKGHATEFIDTEFLPKWRDFITVKLTWNILAFLKGVRWWDWWLFNTQRWFVTNFQRVRIDDANTVMAADLRRYVNDQHYLNRFKTRHPSGYKLWKWLSGCGNNIYLILFWAFILIWVFAGFYGTLPWTVPEWMMFITPDFMIVADPPIDPKLYVDRYPSLSDSMKWFFVSFDIFTNLGIRNTHPQNNIGVILVFLETVLGFSTLGVLIAVATNKWVRRS